MPCGWVATNPTGWTSMITHFPDVSTNGFAIQWTTGSDSSAANVAPGGIPGFQVYKFRHPRRSSGQFCLLPEYARKHVFRLFGSPIQRCGPSVRRSIRSRTSDDRAGTLHTTVGRLGKKASTPYSIGRETTSAVLEARRRCVPTKRWLSPRISRHTDSARASDRAVAGASAKAADLRAALAWSASFRGRRSLVDADCDPSLPAVLIAHGGSAAGPRSNAVPLDEERTAGFCHRTNGLRPSRWRRPNFSS